MFIEVDEVCAVITAKPAPVLFLDTCTILDVLRAPCRESIAVEEISAAMALIKLNGQHTPGVWLVTNETVHGEWTANLDTVRTELERESKKLRGFGPGLSMLSILSTAGHTKSATALNTLNFQSTLRTFQSNYFPSHRR